MSNGFHLSKGQAERSLKPGQIQICVFDLIGDLRVPRKRTSAAIVGTCKRVFLGFFGILLLSRRRVFGSLMCKHLAVCRDKSSERVIRIESASRLAKSKGHITGRRGPGTWARLTGGKAEGLE